MSLPITKKGLINLEKRLQHAQIALLILEEVLEIFQALCLERKDYSLYQKGQNRDLPLFCRQILHLFITPHICPDIIVC